VRRVQETDPSAAYTFGWTHETRNLAASGLTMSVATTPGALAEFTFTGTAVRWLGRRGPHSGIARVFLDGVFMAEIDMFQRLEELQVPIFSADGLADASHTLMIEVTGLRNPSATDVGIVVDAFEVTR
jgi:hypothetical protein